MSAAAASNGRLSAPAIPRRRLSLGRHAIPVTLVIASSFVYAAVAIYTGQSAQLSWSGVMGLLQRMVALGLVAIGQNFVVLAASIDLSVANLISVSAVLASFFMNGDAGSIPMAVALVLLISSGVGALNGVLVARFGVSPLIATLGVSMVLQGVLTVSFSALRGAVPKSFQSIAYGEFAGIPIAVLLLAASAIVSAFVLSRTLVGARLYATGGNAESARMAGIQTTRVLIGAHAASGLMCGLAGLYLVSWLGAGTPWVGRDGGYDLDSIAVVVIGGTLLSGGRGGIAGTMAGVFTFAVIDALFNMLQVDPFLSQVLRGALVVVAVGVYTFRQRGHTA